MNLNIHLDIYGPLPLTSGIPSDLSAYLLTNAVGQHAKGPWGIICIQEIRTEKFLLRHFLFALQKTISFYVREHDHQLQSLLSLSGIFEHKIKGLKPVILKEKEYLLLHAATEELYTTAYGGKIGSLVNTYYTPKSYQGLLPLFPNFKKDLKKAIRKPYLFNNPPKVARYSVHDAINAIWFDRYIQELQVKHTEMRLESSLFTLLAQSYAPSVSEPTSQFEREKASAARDIILADIKVHHPPEFIASELHCSAGWLKKAFSKVYEMGLFQFLRKTRMDFAKEMLLRGESLKAVALEVGMKPQNFPKEFKAFFGYTVTALKKGQV